MKTSKEGIELIKHFEGCSLVPYICPTGYLTIGIGHVILPGEEHLKKGITLKQAEELLVKDLAKFEAAVTKNITTPMTQRQFDAIVSLTFNIGISALSKSTLRRLMNVRDYKGAAEQFLRMV